MVHIGSILQDTKKVLGLAPDYTEFDVDIIMHINSVFSTLSQLGIGPIDGFEITGADETWVTYLGDVKKLNMVRSYMSLKVRMMFDPPTTSFLGESMKQQIDDFEWRISVHREETLYPLVPSEVIV